MTTQADPTAALPTDLTDLAALAPPIDTAETTPLFELSHTEVSEAYPDLRVHGYSTLMAEHRLRSLVLRKGTSTWWAIRDSMDGREPAVPVGHAKLRILLAWVKADGEVS